jgi:hypothetical protein
MQDTAANQGLWSYMLGRLVCGDDSLSVSVRQNTLSDYFRYQIQSANREEGWYWGDTCSNLFGSERKYRYRKSTGQYCTNFVLEKLQVENLISEGFLSLPAATSKARNTSLALIKVIPKNKLLRMKAEEAAGFLAGVFDSDGTIMPKSGQIFISMDTQIANRTTPLAFDEIGLMRGFVTLGYLPKVRMIEIHANECRKSGSNSMVREINKRFPDIRVHEYDVKNRKGLTARLCFSTNSRTDEQNRKALLWLIANVAPKMIRKDKVKNLLRFKARRGLKQAGRES